jgi:hypothetical protein
MIAPFYVDAEVALVGLWGIREGTAVRELFGEMKDSAQKIGEQLVLKEHGVFEKP